MLVNSNQLQTAYSKNVNKQYPDSAQYLLCRCTQTGQRFYPAEIPALNRKHSWVPLCLLIRAALIFNTRLYSLKRHSTLAEISTWKARQTTRIKRSGPQQRHPRRHRHCNASRAVAGEPSPKPAFATRIHNSDTESKRSRTSLAWAFFSYWHPYYYTAWGALLIGRTTK